MVKHHALEVAKHTVDAAAVGITVGTLAQILPAIAALFTIFWTGIRIWETKTMQSIFGKKKSKAKKK